MCGRFSFSTSLEKLKAQLGDIYVDDQLNISYNIAPTQSAYVITNDLPGALQAYRWGLLPFWSKEGKVSGRMINARQETIAEKPAFRQAFRKRRCWVLADSFYEWKGRGNQKIPYRIYPKDGALLLLAGIWEVWKGEETIHTFSIVTTEPNREMQALHDRMPAVLHSRDRQRAWLEEHSEQDLQALLQTPPDDILEMHQVSTRLNSPRNNGADLHRPVGDQNELF